MNSSPAKRVAIITGASAGLGIEFALQAQNNFKDIEEIWLIARREEQLQALADRLSLPARILTLDLGSPLGMQALQEQLEAASIDVVLLVNNAGLGMFGDFSERRLDEHLRVVDINVRALTAITHRVLPYMQKGARILLVASSIAWAPAPSFAVYAASKAYVRNLSLALHWELRQRGIAVTAVCPGPVATEFFTVAQKPEDAAAGKAAAPPHARLTAQPAAVVALAYRDVRRGKSISIYGWPVRIFTWMTNLLPFSLLLRLLAMR